jgi:cytochrome c biogenesis protein CcmG, thiol:disulfide interchange protein DsbE
MSRSRVAALAAVIVVPVAILAIVLASLIDDDGSNNQSAPTAPQPAKGATGVGPTGPTTHSGSVPAEPGTGGSKAPDTSLHVLDKGALPKELSDKIGPASSDGTIKLDELRGSPIVLNIWSADCIPCLAETSVLESEWERLGRRGVLFLGLDVLDSPAAARRFRAENDVTYPSVDEKRASTARAMGATGVPETFFISKSGKIVGHVLGEVSLSHIELGVHAAQTGQAMPTVQGGGQIPLR